MAKVLIVDDDTTICRMLGELVQHEGHEADTAVTLAEGLRSVRLNPYDVVILDVEMPDGSGLEAISKFRQAAPSPEVIIITGYGDPDGAEIAVNNGAWDYVQKPLSARNVILPIRRVLQYRDGLVRAKKPLVALKLEGIIGSSPQMQACFDSLAHISGSSASVLLTGETGTGKELFAKAIHANSSRADGAFVVVDCAALPATLIESSLFGYERGAFTGADKAQVGLIKQADGGTLYLDEVGELPLPIQSAFLRVLQERRFRPIGGKKEIASDFRLISVTNRDLEQMCKAGEFREDILYRLRAATLELPPLRHRSGDIKDLVFYYTAKFCEKYGTETKGFSPDFFEAMCVYEWPGNVRELINTLEGVLSEAPNDPILYPKHLPNYIRSHIARASVNMNETSVSEPFQPPPSPATPPPYREFKEKIISEAEKKYFRNLMSFTKGSIKEACQVSGLGRTQVYTLLKKHDISRLGWS